MWLKPKMLNAIRAGDPIAYICKSSTNKTFINTTVLEVLDEGLRVEGLEGLLDWSEICTPF